MKSIRGLNLGGWLVLEKWMAPELYEQYDAEDEYNLLKQMGDNKHKIIKKHRDSFISKHDFKWIKDYGIDTVRIPIGYWLIEANEPYIEAKSYLDNAFEWAAEYGLNILLDIHAAPGCQNGFDNGGLSGVCEWHLKQENIDKTIRFIEQISIVYKDEVALSGIQVLNEPRWDIPSTLLIKFYKKSYNVIREHLGTDKYIVFHDAFRLGIWKTFFTDNHFENVILDTHMYQVFSHNDSKRTMTEVIEKVSTQRLKELNEVMEYVDVVVGEWSLGIHPNTLKHVKDAFLKDALYRAVGNSLLVTFEQTRGWFFWNYKLSEKATKNNIGWSFVDVVKKGYLPRNAKGD